MDSHNVMDFLRSVELFESLEAPILEEVADAASVISRSAGDYLFVEGDAAGYLFLVRRGAFDVVKEAPGRGEVWLRRMGPGEAGGLTSVVVEKTRSASLRAAADCEVVAVDRIRVLEIMDKYPAMARAIIRVLAAKVRSKTSRLAGMIDQSSDDGRTPVAVFDAKSYDRRYLDQAAGGDLVFRYFESRLRAETVALAAGCAAVCAFVNDDVGAETLEGLAESGIRLVALRCAGFNQVDLDAAARLGIDVVRVPEYSPHAVAEHAMALILALNRSIHRAFNRVREHNFSLAGLVGYDLHGRCAGIVGLGAIGRALAEILRGFGMEVLAYDPYADPGPAEELGVRLVELDELLGAADIVSLHSPLTPATHHLIDAKSIACMKPGAMLINTSRGGLVDTVALIDALKTGQVGAAGLDVYEEESGTFFEDLSGTPISDDVLARLLTFPNVLVTSHQAYLTDDALRAIAGITSGNIREYLAGHRGGELTNAVTRPQ